MVQTVWELDHPTVPLLSATGAQLEQHFDGCFEELGGEEVVVADHLLQPGRYVHQFPDEAGGVGAAGQNQRKLNFMAETKNVPF